MPCCAVVVGHDLDVRFVAVVVGEEVGYGTGRANDAGVHEVLVFVFDLGGGLEGWEERGAEGEAGCLTGVGSAEVGGIGLD